MLEADLRSAAERAAPPADPHLPEKVLARLDEPTRVRRRVVALVAVAATVVTGLGLSPQMRAFAADVLGLAGISIGRDEPSAPPTPASPLPRTRDSDLDRAADLARFPLGVPTRLGPPEEVTVAGGGRVVSMSWRGGEVVLDQLAGRFGPVFEKQVGDAPLVRVPVDGHDAWWVEGPHDLVYVRPSGEVVSATARLAGRTLLWERGGVTYRLEGSLTRGAAVAVAGTLEAPAG